VTVDVLGDNLDEGDEAFTLVLSGASDGSSDPAPATGTIIDDHDPVPSISVAGTRVREGNSGTVGAGFVVTRSNPSGRTVTVDYATADGSAKAPGDYTATIGTLSFSPGQ